MKIKQENTETKQAFSITLWNQFQSNLGFYIQKFDTVIVVDHDPAA